MDNMFLQAFGCIKAISVPPWEIKQCTSTGTWCERVRSHVGKGDKTQCVSRCAHPARPHAPVDIFPKKWLCTYVVRDIATFLFITLVYSPVAAIVFVQLAGFSDFDVWLENTSQARYSKQLCGAILSVFFYQTIYNFPHWVELEKKASTLSSNLLIFPCSNSSEVRYTKRMSAHPCQSLCQCYCIIKVLILTRNKAAL